MNIVITVQGGVIQDISMDEPLDAEIFVIDYDTEGALDEDTWSIEQDDPNNLGSTKRAFVSRWGAGRAESCVLKSLEKWKNEDLAKS